MPDRTPDIDLEPDVPDKLVEQARAEIEALNAIEAHNQQRSEARALAKQAAEKPRKKRSKRG